MRSCKYNSNITADTYCRQCSAGLCSTGSCGFEQYDIDSNQKYYLCNECYYSDVPKIPKYINWLQKKSNELNATQWQKDFYLYSLFGWMKNQFENLKFKTV